MTETTKTITIDTAAWERVDDDVSAVHLGRLSVLHTSPVCDRVERDEYTVVHTDDYAPASTHVHTTVDDAARELQLLLLKGVAS